MAARVVLEAVGGWGCPGLGDSVVGLVGLFVASFRLCNLGRVEL